MTPTNLQEILDSTDPVELLRNSQIGTYIYPVVAGRVHELAPRAAGLARDRGALRPVAPHGEPLPPRSRRAEADLGHRASTASRTSRWTWPSSTCRRRPAGHVIGDGILFHLEAEDEFVYVGRAPAANWLQFHAETGRLRRRDRARRPLSDRARTGKPVTRKLWRFQIQGPNAWQVHREAQRRPDRAGEVLPHGTHERRRAAACAPCATAWPALRGSSSGARTRATTRSARRSSRPAGSSASSPCGSRAYSSNTLESGWIPSPLPAIYTGEELRAYREWLPAHELRGHQRARRQLRLGRHRGLLPQPVGARLRPLREVRPRLRRPRRARADRSRDAAQEGHARVERRRRHGDHGVGLRTARARATSSSTCPTRTTARRTSTRSSTRTARPVGLSHVHRLQREREAGAVARDRRPRASSSAPR